MALATSGTDDLPENITIDEKIRAIFLPIVRKNKLKSWESNYRNWFVTSEDVSFMFYNLGLIIIY